MLIPVSRGFFLPILLLSLLAGFFLGAVYDLFRIRRAAFRLPRTEISSAGRFGRFFRKHIAGTDICLCLVEDLFFSLFGTVVMILLGFKLHYGIPRWYSYAGALGGFLFYRVTVGRLVMRFAEAVVRGVVRLLRRLRRRFLVPFANLLKRLVKTAQRKAKERHARAYTAAEEARMLALFRHLP